MYRKYILWPSESPLLFFFLSGCRAADDLLTTMNMSNGMQLSTKVGEREARSLPSFIWS